jgi:hypothetical protein
MVKEVVVSAATQAAYDDCHVFRHWWQPTTVEIHNGYYVQHLVCQRCTMVRKWKVSRVSGDPLGNNYNAPPEYYHHTEAGEGQRLRRELRLAEIERNLNAAQRRKRGKS